jgi:hypothetical protein
LSACPDVIGLYVNPPEHVFKGIADLRFKGIADLRVAINRFLQEANANPKPFVWTADPDAILDKVCRGKQVLESIHSLTSPFASSRQVNSWLSFKHLLQALSGKAESTTVITTVLLTIDPQQVMG